ncbi:MAG TPA: NAD-dependent epimerase/dehydratase family protein [Paludibacteraceae bacterium]|nr:NAD-dependent epimerase/dehydratase family protein [Paludibacteraceae bacterium]HPT43444.1 NAD-dependent epimerase/dehydratase family protein [Paludibacteraceae bacterium]
MILVTGATGMVGGHLIWYLLQSNGRISALTRSNSNTTDLRTVFEFYTNTPDQYLSRVDWVKGDVLNFNSLKRAFEGMEYIYHCAAIVNLGKNYNEMILTNAKGTENVVNAALCNKVKKLCFVSSIAAVSDDISHGPIDENTPIEPDKPVSTYSESKMLAEKEIEKGIQKGLNAVIVNPGVILGISKKMTGSGELFKLAKKGLPFYTFGKTAYVDVRDVCKAMILLMNSNINGERFIIAGENCYHRDILRWMAEGYHTYRPFIGFGKLLIPLAGVLEIIGKIAGFTPLIDRSSASISISRKEYSCKKFLSRFEFTFTPIRECILEICDFDLKNQEKTVLHP